MFIIYLIKCLRNDKLYVGQTSRSLNVRFQEHIKQASNGKTTCRKLYAAIRKYSAENFIVEKLIEASTQQEADQLEILYIKQFDSINHGYNLQFGGYNGSPSEETRELMSKQHKGVNNAMYGKHHTQAAKNAISLKNKSKPGYWKGKSMSQEIRDKVSISRIGLTAGENNPGAKLTLAQAEEIKILLQDQNYTRQQIANMFGVSLSAIKRIKAGTHWK